MVIDLTVEHPTFDPPTSEVLDAVIIRGKKTAAAGRCHITPTARATSRWQEHSQPAVSTTALAS